MADEPEDSINPEVWLSYLLSQMGDAAAREKLVARVSAKTGLPPEKVEDIFRALVSQLLNAARSN
jgi:hypothetical protein